MKKLYTDQECLDAVKKEAEKLAGLDCSDGVKNRLADLTISVKMVAEEVAELRAKLNKLDSIDRKLDRIDRKLDRMEILEDVNHQIKILGERR